MPLAVKNLTDFKLPLDVTLDDSLALLTPRRLSLLPVWTGTASLSTSRDVRAQAGDLQGQLAGDAAQASQVLELVISERIQAHPP